MSEPTCGQPDRDARLIDGIENSNITYYGPHPCDLCRSGTIVRGAIDQGHGGLRFDYPLEGFIYPNHNWTVHQCPKGACPAPSGLARRLEIAEGILLALAELVGDIGTASGSAGAQSCPLFGHQTADDTRNLVHKIRATYNK